MLRDEISGVPYSKAEHRRALRRLIRDRSEASLENKHRNISAILEEERLTWIDGYKPLFHYQGLLRDVVVEFVDSSDWLVKTMEVRSERIPSERGLFDLVANALLIDAPDRVREGPPPYAWKGSHAKHRDFPARDAANRKLGQLGEEMVFEIERTRLRSIGRDDLAQSVRWTARDQGDGAGYDIESFDDGGRKTFVEVKTTNDHNVRFPFIATRNEVACSEVKRDAYRLVRVFDFSGSTRYFIRSGSIREEFALDPLTFRVMP
jgi:hypothetical protein